MTPWMRRFGPAIAGAVILALVVAIVLLRGGGDQPSTRLAADSDTSTSLPEVGGAPSDPGATTTTTSSGHTSSTGGNSASPAISTSTTRRGDTTTTSGACRNSHDANCPEFHWGTDPGANAPITVDVSYTPAHPTHGETVTFTVHAVDPDATPISECGDGDYGGDGYGCVHTMECRINTGAWDVPPRQRGEATFSHQHAFATAGTYTVSFSVESAGGSKNNSSCGSNPNPYASEGHGSTTVVVS
jgi:hypothetical protein